MKTMNLFRLELNKILNRRMAMIPLIATPVFFVALVTISTYFEAQQNQVPEGSFADRVAQACLNSSQLYLFIPLWIFLIAGTEFFNGHVNRVVFESSRVVYFRSKLAFCFLLSLYFLTIQIITLSTAVAVSPFRFLTVESAFYVQFALQALLANLCFALLLMMLLFIVKSPVKAFAFYFLWMLIEGLSFRFVKGLYEFELIGLPLHLTRLLMSKNGEMEFDQYYNPIVSNPVIIFLPVAFTALVTSLTFFWFKRSSLPALSD